MKRIATASAALALAATAFGVAGCEGTTSKADEAADELSREMGVSPSEAKEAYCAVAAGKAAEGC